MRSRKHKARAPILAAGGVVLRSSREPLIAVVMLRKYGHWVLPKGKINQDETALAAARREVLEEVGYRAYVHAFLGTIAYDVGQRTKVVQFWAMRAIGGPSRRLTPDVKAVEWLPLEDAIRRLTRSREQVFLRSIGRVAIKAIQRAARRERIPLQPTRHARSTQVVRTRAFGPGDQANREHATSRSRAVRAR
jgi:8-oxo-dGTP diphosphatase